MTDTVKRATAVRLHQDIEALRRMLKAAIPTRKELNRVKTTEYANKLNDLRGAYKIMKQEQRRFDELRRGEYVKTATHRIGNAFNILCGPHPFSHAVKIGKPVHASSLGTSRRSHVHFTISYLWYHRVWQTIHNDHRMATPNTIVLEATEYRTNVPHIRLYEALAYNVISKKINKGWVGQTKLGKQKCAFAKERHLAINEALKLTTKSIDNQVKGEIS